MMAAGRCSRGALVSLHDTSVNIIAHQTNSGRLAIIMKFRCRDRRWATLAGSTLLYFRAGPSGPKLASSCGMVKRLAIGLAGGTVGGLAGGYGWSPGVRLVLRTVSALICVGRTLPPRHPGGPAAASYQLSCATVWLAEIRATARPENRICASSRDVTRDGSLAWQLAVHLWAETTEGKGLMALPLRRRHMLRPLSAHMPNALATLMRPLP